MTTKKAADEWAHFLSPIWLILVAVNAFCFGGLLVLLATGRGGGSVLLTISTGVLFCTGLTGALIASVRARRQGVLGDESAGGWDSDHVGSGCVWKRV